MKIRVNTQGCQERGWRILMSGAWVSTPPRVDGGVGAMPDPGAGRKWPNMYKVPFMAW